MYREIVVSDETGSAEGYEVDARAENLGNWLAKHGVFDFRLIGRVQDRHERVAILNNLNIEEERQGKGHGTRLLEEWLAEVEASVVLLLADVHESQRCNFDLVRFYKKFGFVVWKKTVSGPLMALEQEI